MMARYITFALFAVLAVLCIAVEFVYSDQSNIEGLTALNIRLYRVYVSSKGSFSFNSRSVINIYTLIVPLLCIAAIFGFYNVKRAHEKLYSTTLDLLATLLTIWGLFELAALHQLKQASPFGGYDTIINTSHFEGFVKVASAICLLSSRDTITKMYFNCALFLFLVGSYSSGIKYFPIPDYKDTILLSLTLLLVFATRRKVRVG